MTGTLGSRRGGELGAARGRGVRGRGGLWAGLDLARRRATGRFEVDEWGADRDLIDALHGAVRLATRVQLAGIEVEGAEALPSGPALVVANRRLGLAEPLILQAALGLTAGRRARFVGIPDVAPLGLMLRRVGGAVGRPGEVKGLLGAGHVVLVPLTAERRLWPLRAGTVDPELIRPAVDLSVPIVPAAVLGGELTGRWKVIVGRPVALAPRTARHSPLALAELADAARAGVQDLLDEATPPRRAWAFR